MASTERLHRQGSSYRRQRGLRIDLTRYFPALVRGLSILGNGSLPAPRLVAPPEFERSKHQPKIVELGGIMRQRDRHHICWKQSPWRSDSSKWFQSLCGKLAAAACTFSMKRKRSTPAPRRNNTGWKFRDSKSRGPAPFSLRIRASIHLHFRRPVLGQICSIRGCKSADIASYLEHFAAEERRKLA
jgi:hypothetical protein